MNKVKNGKKFYAKDDRRKQLIVICEDGDKIGVVATIVPGCEIPSPEIKWTTEKEIMKTGQYNE
ncbi:MAG: hypothetical protein GY861_12595 [bacterium]|nr:hypothetical protein [bacterium]